MRKSFFILIIVLIVLSAVSGGCQSAPAVTTTTPIPTPPPPITTATAAPSPTSVPSPTPSQTTVPPQDTTPPPAISALIAHDSYDGKVNLWWDESNATDFGYYNVYVNETGITDTSGLEPVRQIKEIAVGTCQIINLENGTVYHFAVTAVDINGNEDKLVTSVTAIPTLMSQGVGDPILTVDVYQSEKAWAGTTILPDNHDIANPRIVEINMRGEIVWQYLLPAKLKRYTNPGFDAELLKNNDVLFVLPGNGVYEIDRNGNVVWSYIDAKVSHDADRLPNGNTLVVYGNNDQKEDAQVKEIDPSGKIVWSWYARSYFNEEPYLSIFEEGWTHTNAVSRLENGNTLISPRNFNMLVEVAPDGEVVKTYGEGLFVQQHDPVILPNGDILLCNHDRPHKVIEYNPETGTIVWQTAGFKPSESPVRDANRLPNGNTLITCTTKIIEITPDGEIVWEMILKGITLTGPDAASLGFYKAERIDP
jgi:hypothetical protein